MRNNRPKSENPAMKEHAARDKDVVARQRSTEAEKAAAHPHQKDHAAGITAAVKPGARRPRSPGA
jgi:hypothetical protein